MHALAVLALFALPAAGQDPEPDAPVVAGHTFTPEELLHWTKAERAELAAIFADFSAARAAARDAEVRLFEFLLAHGVANTPTEPAPNPEPEPTDEFAAWDALPFAVPRPPVYTVPTLADCDWTIANGVATSTRGLPSITNANPINDAYRASLNAGHELPIVVGVWDNAGSVWPGGLYNPDNDVSISIPEGTGWHAVELEIVGLDDSCEVNLGWSKRWGEAKWLGAFNIGLRAPNDSFVIRANEGIGTYIQDGCWWLPNVKPDGTPALHASGLHIDNWQRLVLRRQRYRGVLPTDPGTLLREHSFYLKACVGDPAAGGGTWILENDLRGGDRTGFQIRPDQDNAVPRGPVVIADNVASGFAWDHGANAPGGGGGLVTVWMNPNDATYVFGNVFTDARYSCLVLSGQAPDRNWLNEDGFPIAGAYVYGNTFENLRASRACASISAVQEVHLWANEFRGPLNGDLVLDDPWNHAINGIQNGAVRVHGSAWLEDLVKMRVVTWDPNAPTKAAPMPEATLRSYLVP